MFRITGDSSSGSFIQWLAKNYSNGSIVSVSDYAAINTDHVHVNGHSTIERILCPWKVAMTPTGIEPATFRFVATAVPQCEDIVSLFYLRNTFGYFLPALRHTCGLPDEWAAW